ncbi:hypothetical protein [Amycolatopsis pithecellobii]|uniref:Uncharacterized protein n=1 Tax=Amycolatopsis pithecellobii TaxID=664692 RepID=A0A6N7YVX2_9PSEU|nr:hypothetical protein [Amycolatopsis pithecellobii]MTD57215.1 hypothetical protein [Amycolatopsis pithecellobii]
MSYPGQQPQYGEGQYGGQPQQPGPYGGPPQPGPYGYGAPGQYGYPAPQYGYGPRAPWDLAPPTSNIPAAIVLILGGLAGLLQFFLEWFSFRDQVVTGKDVADLAGVADTAGSSAGTMIMIGVYLVLVGGGVSLLGGAVLFVPMRGGKRVLGALLLVVSLAMIAGMIFWLAAGIPNPDSTGPGYYFFLGAGAVTLIGSVIALIKR